MRPGLVPAAGTTLSTDPLIARATRDGGVAFLTGRALTPAPVRRTFRTLRAIPRPSPEPCPGPRKAWKTGCEAGHSSRGRIIVSSPAHSCGKSACVRYSAPTRRPRPRPNGARSRSTSKSKRHVTLSRLSATAGARGARSRSPTSSRACLIRRAFAAGKPSVLEPWQRRVHGRALPPRRAREPPLQARHPRRPAREREGTPGLITV